MGDALVFCLDIGFDAEERIMKVLVSDNLGEEGIKLFQNEEGIDVDVKATPNDQ